MPVRFNGLQGKEAIKVLEWVHNILFIILMVLALIWIISYADSTFVKLGIGLAFILGIWTFVEPFILQRRDIFHGKNYFALFWGWFSKMIK